MTPTAIGKVVCIKIAESLLEDAPRLELELNKIYEVVKFGWIDKYYYILRSTGPGVYDIFPVGCFLPLAEMRNQKIDEILDL